MSVGHTMMCGRTKRKHPIYLFKKHPCAAAVDKEVKQTGEMTNGPHRRLRVETKQTPQSIQMDTLC